MALSIQPLNAISDDATFRANGKRISDQIVAVGLVRRTAGEDSGQIDWATVARPAANNTAGYEVFAFADALQATVPVLIKISWGCGAATNGLRMLIDVGFKTDGAGGITGYTGHQLTLTSNSADVAATITRVSGDTNRLCLAHKANENATAACNLFSIERTHTVVGGDTADGVFVFSKIGSTGNICFLLTVAGGELDYHANYTNFLHPSVGAGSTGAQTMVFPIFPARGPWMFPSLNVAAVFAVNITVGVPFSFTLLGSSRSFIPLPTTGFPVYPYTALAGFALLMRNE